MTDETETAQLAYFRTLLDLERDGMRTTIKIGPFAMMMLIGWIQLGARHPSATAQHRQIGRDLIDQMSPFFAGTPGEEIIRQGNHPDFDRAVD
jgi:hypothetical protein